MLLCDGSATPVRALNRRHGGSRVAEHGHNDSLLLSAGSFALLFGFYCFGSLCLCSFCFSLRLFYFICNSRFVIFLSSSFLVLFVVLLLLLFVIHPLFILQIYLHVFVSSSLLFMSVHSFCLLCLSFVPAVLLVFTLFPFHFLPFSFCFICSNYVMERFSPCCKAAGELRSPQICNFLYPPDISSTLRTFSPRNTPS